jgi:hypothetical protein
MWFNILKVDRFARIKGKKGLYDPSDDTVTIDLDNFTSRGKNYDDEERTTEFSNVATHEYSHREYAKELNEAFDKALKELFDAHTSYSKGQGSIEDTENKFQKLLNYVISNEDFAYASEKTYKNLRIHDMTEGSTKSVFNQIIDWMRKQLPKEDILFERMVNRLENGIERGVGWRNSIFYEHKYLKRK